MVCVLPILDASEIKQTTLRWQYLSKATCMMRIQVFYAVFVVSRIIIHYLLNYMIRQF